MNHLDRMGHWGYLSLALGHAIIATGASPSLGWPLRLLGELVWCCIGWRAGLRSATYWGALFAALDLWAAVQALR